MMSANKEVAVTTENGTQITEHGEIINNVALAIKNAKRISFNADAIEFVHVRNDCGASGGFFKVGNTQLCESMNATYIDAQAIANVDPFVKKGESPKPTDWVQILFVDNEYGNLKSTLIKTRSISEFRDLVMQAMAVKEDLAGMAFEMSFLGAVGENEQGKFSYKYLTFKKLKKESQYKELALSIKAKLDSGEVLYPSFLN